MYYNRIDVNEGIDLPISNNIKEYMICLHWFFNHGFRFQGYVSNGCHDLIMLSINIRDVAIITVACRCIIHNIRKFEATSLLNISVLEDPGCL